MAVRAADVIPHQILTRQQHRKKLICFDGLRRFIVHFSGGTHLIWTLCFLPVVRDYVRLQLASWNIIITQSNWSDDLWRGSKGAARSQESVKFSSVCCLPYFALRALCRQRGRPVFGGPLSAVSLKASVHGDWIRTFPGVNSLRLGLTKMNLSLPRRIALLQSHLGSGEAYY